MLNRLAARIAKRMAEVRKNRLYVVEFKFGKWIRSYEAGAPTQTKSEAQAIADSLREKALSRHRGGAYKFPYRVVKYERTGVVRGSRRG